MSAAATGAHAGQTLQPGEEIGLRNQLRARWRAVPEPTRIAIVAGVELALGVLLFFVDHSLGYAVWIVSGLFWMRRMRPLPHRLAAEAGLVALLAILAAVSSTPWSLVLLLAIFFAVFWIPERRRPWAIPVVAIVATAFYPFYVGHMFTIPVFGAWPDVPTGVYMLVFVIMAVGLNIVVGYAGLLDLGYVAFYATGAYTAAWFASEQFAGVKCPKAGVSVADCPVATVPAHSFSLGAVGTLPGLGGIHVSIWLLLLLAGVITAFFGVVIGLPTLRLRGDYLAIVTLGFGEILPQIARNGDNLFGYNITNGPNGITPIDSPGFGHTLSSATGGFLPSNYLQCCSATIFHHQIQSADVFFWTAIVLLLITVFCSFRLQFSRLGRAWIAIREDETAAAAMGIPLMRTKTWAYASGAFFGGIAGAYYAAFKSNTFPGDFFFNISVFILCMVILGGMGNIWGVIVGGAFLAYLNQEGLANTGSWIDANIHVGGWHPNLDVPLYAAGIYGVIIVVTMLFRPEGLIPSRRRAAELHEGVHDEPLYDTEHAGAEA
ncbi:MAG TPA: branched-chain amino acid ABC transporter permease [Gaiellaceae bacterium]